ncbi:MAG: ABC transporter permease [Phycisphaerales bacterium]|nr:ABC transporter permease [Phycisphaerales bacterium]
MSVNSIMVKDLKVLTRDHRALVVLLLMPMVFIAILGFSTGQLIGWQNENTTLTLTVHYHPGDTSGQRFVDRLSQREGLAVTVARDAADARRQVDRGDRTAALLIGPTFAERVGRLRLRDALQPDEGPLASGLAGLDLSIYTSQTQAIAEALTGQLVWATLLRFVASETLERDPLARTYLEQSAPAASTQALPIEPLAPSPSLETTDFRAMAYQIIVPAYTVLFAFFLINIMARSFLAEQKLGTLDRLRVAPVGSLVVLFGKIAPFYLLSIIQGVTLFVFGRLLFGMSWGPAPGMLLFVVACTSLAATTLGLLVAVLVRTDAQVSAYANLLVIALGGLSGCFMPRAWLPEAMRTISLAIPHAWSLIAYDQLLTVPMPDMLQVVICCVMLLLFSLLFLAAGCWGFRQMCHRQGG